MEFDEMRGAELFFCRSFVFPSVSRHFFCMFASTAAFNKLVVGEGMGGACLMCFTTRLHTDAQRPGELQTQKALLSSGKRSCC